MMVRKLVIATSFIAAAAQADLVALDDQELSTATGEGLGFALEDFMLDSESATLSITGIKSSAGDEIDIDWTSLYIMGEGSQEGTSPVAANIGSYLNPYVIRTVRGSYGLDVNDPNYNERYAQVGNDLALLEFATESFESDLQSSEIFGVFSYYQGCVWGEAGCNDLNDVGANGIAVTAINDEVNGLLSDRNDITSIYNSANVSFVQLENAIDSHYTNSILPQLGVIESEQADFDAAVAELNARYDPMADAFNAFDAAYPDNECVLGEDCSNADANCGWSSACASSRDNYNDAFSYWDDQRGVRQDEYNELIAARQELDRIKSDPAEFGTAGVSYIQAVEDLDEFKVLCGFEKSFTACTDGVIARKEKTAEGVENVSVALFNGAARRNGLDIGASFQFELNAVDANGVTSPRTDYLDINMKGVFVDGTAIRLWAAPDAQGDDEINGELRLNFFAKELDISVCDPNVCDNNATAKEASTLNLDNLLIVLNLGYGEIQPMRFAATADGNFEFELTKPNPEARGIDTNNQDAMQGFYEDYYADAPKSFISVSDVRIGNGANASLGGITVDGLRAQYLKVTSRDL